MAERLVIVVEKTIPEFAHVELKLTPLRSVPKDKLKENKTQYPAGLIESLFPLVRSTFVESGFDLGDNDDYWQKIEENATFSVDDAKKMLKSHKLSLYKTSSAILNRLLHEKIQYGEISSDMLTSMTSTLAAKLDSQPPKRTQRIRK